MTAARINQSERRFGFGIVCRSGRTAGVSDATQRDLELAGLDDAIRQFAISAIVAGRFAGSGCSICSSKGRIRHVERRRDRVRARRFSTS